MRQQLVKASLAPVVLIFALVGCGSSAKKASTATTPDGISLQSPAQSQGAKKPPSTGTLAPGETAPPEQDSVAETSSVPTTYIVQKGDQLKRIATKFGVDLIDLMTVNNIVNADKIRYGQRLIIPPPRAPGDTTPAATPAPTKAPATVTVTTIRKKP
jgi:LysM repeat protein